MKLNSFKFQDGKVLWLPEYPEWPKYLEDSPLWNRVEETKYNEAVAQSLASAIEVAPEEIIIIKRLIVESVYKNGQVGDATKVITSMWQPENSKVYSAECEMETHYEEIVRGQWVSSSKGIFELVSRSKQPDEVRRFAHIKPKDEIFPAANSHDMKDEDL